MRYPGGKGRTFQHVINLIPPHRVYIETHLGGGAVMRHKRPSAYSIGIDADQKVIGTWSQREDAKMPLLTRGNPQFSVPITGTVLPYFQISNMAMPGVIDSIGVAVTNPTSPSDSSVALGRRYFQVNCAVCHGDDGAGTKNMIVMKYGLGINIVGDGTKARSDGYIYGMIRNGRGLMPSYNRIEEADRWHVVNYVRGLQGKLGKDVEKGPLGYPGQTGTALPGYTTLGPTRPVPFAKPGRATGVDVRSDGRAAAGPKKGGDQ